MSTTAKEALRLVDEGRADYKTIEHTDPPVNARINYVYIPETGEYVDMGEVRLSGTVVILGSLRGHVADFPPVYEDTKGKRIWGSS